MAAGMLVLLAAPLAGAAVLALIGHRRYAAEANIAFSIVTFGAAARLALTTILRRKGRVLDAMDRSNDLFDSDSPLDLSAKEKTDLIDRLRGRTP